MIDVVFIFQAEMVLCRLFWFRLGNCDELSLLVQNERFFWNIIEMVFIYIYSIFREFLILIKAARTLQE